MIAGAQGHSARILSLSGPQDVVDRLREMGFCEGVSVEVIRRLPFGGPCIVQMGASAFALRQEEAMCAHVEWLAA